MAWKKGQSGNPAGKKKGVLSTVRLRLRDKITDDDLEEALKVVRYHLKKNNLEAAKYLIDQKLGKATQPTELDVTGTFEEWLRSHK